MACSPCIRDQLFDDDAGFATPAAVLISLALATVAVALQVRAVEALHASQADYLRTVAELRLDGAQAMAAAALSGGRSATNGAWSLDLDGASIEVRSEPDEAKLPLAAAHALNPTVLGALNPAVVQVQLERLAAAGDGDPEALAALDPSPVWKACAPRYISAYGRAQALGDRADTPILQARTGEVWRVSVQDPWGWRDVRTLRFTGDPTSAARVIYRSFHRTRSGDATCPLVPRAPL